MGTDLSVNPAQFLGVLVVGLVLMGLLAVLILFALWVDRLAERAERASRIRRAARGFAKEAAEGHFDEAEGWAARVVDAHPGSGGRSVAHHRGSSCPSVPVVTGTPLAMWDEWAILVAAPEEVRACLLGPAQIVSWFPGAERSSQGDRIDLRLSPGRRARLRILSEDWVADEGALAFKATSEGGVLLAGHLTLRAAMTKCPAGTAIGTEVRIHVEGPDTAEGRRILWAIRTVARAGLEHMRAELSLA